MTCREWLLQNEYEDVFALTEKAIALIKAKSKKSRRDWWDTLAGGVDGKPSVREGIEFPVLRTAQIRQGKPITANAIWRGDNEQPPDVVATKRWARKMLPNRLRGTAQQRVRKIHAKAS
jgi:hypothetical protein